MSPEADAGPAPDRRTSTPPPLPDEIDPDVRRIPLSNGLFAIVDAADYEMVSKYRSRTTRKVEGR